MTAAEWEACTDPRHMLLFLHYLRRPRARPSIRKLRLFLCARCRHFWDELPDPRARRIVEAAERHADRQATLRQVRQTLRSGEPARGWLANMRDERLEWLKGCPDFLVRTLRWVAAGPLRRMPGHVLRFGPLADPMVALDARRFRDVVPSPFHQGTEVARWRTGDVMGVARGIYEDRAFDRLPILADALMDAGCEDEVLLAHCRSDGPHVRGCWAVDRLLGKR